MSHKYLISRNSLFERRKKNKHVIDKVLLQIVDTDYTSTQTTIDPGDVVTFACFTMDFSSEYGDRVIQEGDYAGNTGLGKFGNFIKDDRLERKNW